MKHHCKCGGIGRYKVISETHQSITCDKCDKSVKSLRTALVWEAWINTMANELEHGHKKCSKCETVKPVADFGKCNSTKDGYKYSCTECTNAYHVAWRALQKANPTKKVKPKQSKDELYRKVLASMTV